MPFQKQSVTFYLCHNPATVIKCSLKSVSFISMSGVVSSSCQSCLLCLYIALYITAFCVIQILIGQIRNSIRIDNQFKWVRYTLWSAQNCVSEPHCVCIAAIQVTLMRNQVSVESSLNYSLCSIQWHSLYRKQNTCHEQVTNFIHSL